MFICNTNTGTQVINPLTRRPINIPAPAFDRFQFRRQQNVATARRLKRQYYYDDNDDINSDLGL